MEEEEEGLHHSAVRVSRISATWDDVPSPFMRKTMIPGRTEAPDDSLNMQLPRTLHAAAKGAGNSNASIHKQPTLQVGSDQVQTTVFSNSEFENRIFWSLCRTHLFFSSVLAERC